MNSSWLKENVSYLNRCCVASFYRITPIFWIHRPTGTSLFVLKFQVDRVWKSSFMKILFRVKIFTRNSEQFVHRKRTAKQALLVRPKFAFLDRFSLQRVHICVQCPVRVTLRCICTFHDAEPFFLSMMLRTKISISLDIENQSS